MIGKGIIKFERKIKFKTLCKYKDLLYKIIPFNLTLVFSKSVYIFKKENSGNKKRIIIALYINIVDYYSLTQIIYAYLKNKNK